MPKNKFIFLLINLQLLSFILGALFIYLSDIHGFITQNKWKFQEPSMVSTVFILYTAMFSYIMFFIFNMHSKSHVISYKSRLNISNRLLLVMLVLIYLCLILYFGRTFRIQANVFGKLIISPLSAIITVYLLCSVLTTTRQKYFNFIMIFLFSLGASGIGHFIVCLGLVILNFWQDHKSNNRFMIVIFLSSLALPLMLFYLIYYKYGLSFSLSSVIYLFGWILERLHVQVGLGVFLIENSFEGATYLNGLKLSVDALQANFCKLWGCRFDVDYKSINQYAFSLFYGGIFSESSPGASPLSFGSGVLVFGYWFGPLGASIFINGLSHLFSGWHVFVGRKETFKVIIIYAFVIKFMFFSPLSLLNIVDPYFVRVLIFVLAPTVYIALNSKPNHKLKQRL
jgi:hypothetical protein